MHGVGDSWALWNHFFLRFQSTPLAQPDPALTCHHPGQNLLSRTFGHAVGKEHLLLRTRWNMAGCGLHQSWNMAALCGGYRQAPELGKPGLNPDCAIQELSDLR
jgi:hypothetical protein